MEPVTRRNRFPAALRCHMMGGVDIHGVADQGTTWPFDIYKTNGS